MPLLGTRGAASARGFGMLSLGQSFWIATLGGTNNEYGQGIAVDSTGNCYAVGRTDSTGAGDNDLLITKYNESGIIQWQRVLGGSTNDRGNGIAVDGSGNCYVTGQTDSTGAGNFDVLITKYDTSGTIQWQRVLGGTNNEYGQGIAVDSSGNCYVTGQTNSTGAGNFDVLITKYDTSGTIQWQRVLGGTNNEYGQGIAVDSSGNCYVTGVGFIGGSNKLVLAKYDTSGTIQWQRTLEESGYSLFGNGIFTNSTGDCYVTGYRSLGTNDVIIAKYDATGALQWQRLLSGGVGYGIAIDSSSNCYMVGQTTGGAGGIEMILAKYDTAGTIQWQRFLGTTDSDGGLGVSVDTSGNIHVTGRSGPTNDVLIAKLPGDGSKTGTYGPWIYQASSLTASTPSFTAATSSLTAATSTLTAATSSLTAATSTLTSTVTQL